MKQIKSKYAKPQINIICTDACPLMSGSVSMEMKNNGSGDASGAMSNRQTDLWDNNWDERTENWMK